MGRVVPKQQFFAARTPIAIGCYGQPIKPVMHLGYEACCSGRLQINFVHLGILNVRRNLDTREVSLFASLRKTATTADIQATSFASAARLITESPWRVKNLYAGVVFSCKQEFLPL